MGARSTLLRAVTMLAALACVVLLPAIVWAGGEVEAKKEAPKAEAKEATEAKEISAVEPAKPAINCMDCHGSTPKYPVLGARLGYDYSGHKNNGNSRYANGGGCQRCHTNEGFIDYVATGTADASAFVEYPSQPGCFTCHAPHEKGDLSLRTVAPVKLSTGQVIDIGKGNLCANCHQARTPAATTVVPTAAKNISASWGAHHGPEADILAGTNAFEFAGKSYSSSPHMQVVADGCVQCHGTQPSARYGWSPSLGGHSFKMVGDVHEAPKVNNSGCISCHKDANQVPGTEYFNIMAKDDYDQDGTKEPLQAEVRGLLDKFVNKNGSGALQKLALPMYGPAGAWLTAKAETVRPLNEMGALYNYKMILEDRSLGVHNATYVLQVLYDSLQAVDLKFDVSKRPQ